MNLSSCAYQFFLGNISITVYREIFATVLFLAFLSSLSAGECLKFTKKKTQLFLSLQERNLHWTKIILHTVFLKYCYLFSSCSDEKLCVFSQFCNALLHIIVEFYKLARLHIIFSNIFLFYHKFVYRPNHDFI